MSRLYKQNYSRCKHWIWTILCKTRWLDPFWSLGIRLEEVQFSQRLDVFGVENPHVIFTICSLAICLHRYYRGIHSIMYKLSPCKLLVAARMCKSCFWSESSNNWEAIFPPPTGAICNGIDSLSHALYKKNCQIQLCTSYISRNCNLQH